jgi:hypothetical protein
LLRILAFLPLRILCKWGKFLQLPQQPAQEKGIASRRIANTAQEKQNETQKSTLHCGSIHRA